MNVMQWTAKAATGQIDTKPFTKSLPVVEKPVRPSRKDLVQELCDYLADAELPRVQVSKEMGWSRHQATDVIIAGVKAGVLTSRIALDEKTCRRAKFVSVRVD